MWSDRSWVTFRSRAMSCLRELWKTISTIDLPKYFSMCFGTRILFKLCPQDNSKTTEFRSKNAAITYIVNSPRLSLLLIPKSLSTVHWRTSWRSCPDLFANWHKCHKKNSKQCVWHNVSYRHYIGNVHITYDLILISNPLIRQHKEALQ